MILKEAHYCVTCGTALPSQETAGSLRCVRCLATQLLVGLEDDTLLKEDSREQLGPYRLEKELGSGGFGTVWLAEQQEPFRRQVAIKILKRGMDSEQVLTRFRAEQQALAAMSHPNITAVYDAGITPDGRPYFAMEFVEGEPLGQCYKDFDLATRLRIFVEVCMAVDHAHSCGIIHRDLKPSNILVQVESAGALRLAGQTKVIDFGIAKAAAGDDDLVTCIRQVMGTPAYMSPEQATTGGAHVDMRSDVYSLGKILEGLIAAQAVPELKWITLRATMKEPGERYGSVAALADDVNRYLSEQPVLARPLSRAYRMRKYTRRHASWIWGGLVCLALGLIACLWLRHYAVMLASEQEISATRDRQLEVIQERDRKRSAEVAYQLASERSRAERPRDALAYYCQALRKDPKLHAASQALLHELAYRTLPQHREKGATPLVVRHHNKPLLIGLFSDGGEHFNSFTEDGTLYMFGAYTGWPRLFPFKLPYDAVPFAKSVDRPIVGFVRPDQVVSFLNWETLRNEPVQFKLAAPFAWGAMTKSGDAVVIACTDGSLACWDLHTGEQKCRWHPHTETIQIIDLTADGRFAVVCSSDHTGTILDLTDGSMLGARLTHAAAITYAEIAPNQRWVVTGSTDNTARVWDLKTGKPLTPPLRHEGEATERGIIASFSRDSQRVITAGSNDCCVRIWDAQTGEVADESLRHPAPVLSFEVDSGRTRVVTGAEDGKGRLWDLQRAELIAPPWTMKEPVTKVAFAPDRSRLALIAANGDVQIHELAPSDAELPEWFLQLAEAIAGKQVNERGVLVDMPSELMALRVSETRYRLKSYEEQDARIWADWLLSDQPIASERSPFLVESEVPKESW